MEGFHYRDGVLHVDALPVPPIVGEAGTPCWVYSGAKIRERYAALDSALRRALGDHSFRIAFACKANGNLAILRLLHTLGAGADIVSGGELRRAMAAGMPPSHVIFSGVGKSVQDIASALRCGIGQINVESAEELAQIISIAEDLRLSARIALRINPDVDAGTHAKITTGKSDNKFGIPVQAAESLWRKAHASRFVEPVGLSLHIGSQIMEPGPFAQAFEVLASTAKALDAQSVDVGGGLGVAYREHDRPLDLDTYCGLIRDRLGPLKVPIILEPGRFLVAEAGALLTRVLYIKKGLGKQYLILDAGMNDLLRPALYDAWHPIWPVMRPHDAEGELPFDIVGPVCETGDTFGIGRRLKTPVAPGDLMAVLCAGAYGAVMSSTYNARPLAPEVLVDGTRKATVRAAQTIEDLLAQDAVPDWLS